MKESLAARAFAGLAVEMNAYTLRFCGTEPNEIVAFMKEHGYVIPASQLDALRANEVAVANAFFTPCND